MQSIAKLIPSLPLGSDLGLSRSSNNKFNRKSTSRQAFLELNFNLEEKIFNDPLSYYQSLFPSERALFDYLLMLNTRCRHMYPTLAHMAKKTKFSARQLQRNINKFVEEGILLTRYRHNTSSEYRLNPFFHQYKVQNIIRTLSNGVKFISLALLLPFSRYQANELSSGFEPGCRAKTLNEQLYKSRNRFNTIRSYARGWRTPRPASTSELWESQIIWRNNEMLKKEPFYGSIRRFGMLWDLSTAGKCDLMRYPEVALDYVEDVFLAKHHKLTEPLRWLHAQCIRYCQDKELRIDHNLAQSMAKNMRVSLNDSKYTSPSNLTQDERSASRQGNHNEGQLSVDLSGSLNESAYGHAQNDSFKKRDNEGSSTYGNTQSSGHGIKTSFAKEPAQAQALTPEYIKENDLLYDPTTGVHYKPKQPSQPSRVRPRGEPAPVEVAREFLDLNIRNLTNGFKMPGDGSTALPIKNAQQVEAELDLMYERMRNYGNKR